MSTSIDKCKIFNEIYASYKNDLIRYAFSLTKEKEKSEDLLQDTLIIAWKNLENIKEMSKVKYWLMTIMRREFLKNIQANKFNNVIDYETLSEILKSNYNCDKIIEFQQMLDDLKELSDKYKEVLILHSILGYKTSEIAKKLNTNENTISTRIARAKLKILEK